MDWSPGRKRITGKHRKERDEVWELVAYLIFLIGALIALVQWVIYAPVIFR